MEGGVDSINLSLGIGPFWILGATPPLVNAARSKVAGSLPMKRWWVQLLTTPELPRDKDEALSAFPPDRGISEHRVNEGR